MITFAIQHLNECIRASLVAHFLALPLKDRSLRFGTSLAPALIADYVDQIDFDRDAVFGVHDDRLVLFGVAHLAIEDDLAELALSVLPAHRDRGVGSALFRRAVTHARNHHVPRLFMHCRSTNGPIMRIAQKFGLDIVAGWGDAEAYLELQPPSPASFAVPAGKLVQAARSTRRRSPPRGRVPNHEAFRPGCQWRFSLSRRDARRLDTPRRGRPGEGRCTDRTARDPLEPNSLLGLPGRPRPPRQTGSARARPG